MDLRWLDEWTKGEKARVERNKARSASQPADADELNGTLYLKKFPDGSGSWLMLKTASGDYKAICHMTSR